MTASTSDRTGLAVADFLLDRLDEDHEVAWGAASSPWKMGAWAGGFDDAREVLDRLGEVTARCYYGGTYGHVLRFDPTRVLRDIEAKRAVVLRCARVESLAPSQHLAFGILDELAVAYADHPDYREEWKP